MILFFNKTKLINYNNKLIKFNNNNKFKLININKN